MCSTAEGSRRAPPDVASTFNCSVSRAAKPRPGQVAPTAIDWRRLGRTKLTAGCARPGLLEEQSETALLARGSTELLAQALLLACPARGSPCPAAAFALCSRVAFPCQCSFVTEQVRRFKAFHGSKSHREHIPQSSCSPAFISCCWCMERAVWAALRRVPVPQCAPAQSQPAISPEPPRRTRTPEPLFSSSDSPQTDQDRPLTATPAW